MPRRLWEQVGLKGDRALRFIGLDRRDFVHYEVATPFHSPEEIWQAISDDRMPFRTHAQFCAQVLQKAECDCGASWVKFGQDGALIPHQMPDQAL
jgi:hypothetical protein